MKKYKLIKEYPGSLSLGTITSSESKTDLWKGTNYYDKYPEYWEEVVEKDYEIISWTAKDCNSIVIKGSELPHTPCSLPAGYWRIHSVKRLSDGEVFTIGDKFTISEIGISDIITEIVLADSVKWSSSVVTKEIFLGCENDHQYILSSVNKPAPLDYEIISYVAKDNPNNITTKRRGAHLHEEYWKIHSVKRLSDGEVFTVGDIVKVREQGSKKVIEKFEIVNDKSSIRNGVWIEYPCGGSHLRGVAKVQQPIFLTHDGKDIFPKDTVWYVNKENLYYDYIVAYPEVKFNSEIRAYFLTRQEAEEYVEKNKVLFTTEDGYSIRHGEGYYFVNTDFNIDVSKANYQTVAMSDEKKYFATLAAAESYVVQKSPSLSIEDFWEFVSWGGSNIAKSKRLKRLVKERLNLK